jgi:hypothetical protein
MSSVKALSPQLARQNNFKKYINFGRIKTGSRPDITQGDGKRK